MLARALEHFGGLDCLLNNEGEGTGAAGSIVFLGIKHAAPLRRRQGGGNIFSTGSVAGIRAGFSSSTIS